MYNFLPVDVRTTGAIAKLIIFAEFLKSFFIIRTRKADIAYPAYTGSKTKILTFRGSFVSLYVFSHSRASMDQLFYIIQRGIAIGSLISAPMGPIGMLVIQRTLSKGRLQGLFTGLGASVSDIIYCLLTGFCMSFVTGFIERHQLIIQLTGGIVLAAFGLYLYKKNPTRALKTADVPATANFWNDAISGFFLTFSNPLILFFIIGLFARFSFLQPEYMPHHYIAAYLSIIAGAVAWWYLVTLLVSRLKGRFNVRSLWLINRIIASLLFIMAFAGVGMAVYDYFTSTT